MSKWKRWPQVAILFAALRNLLAVKYVFPMLLCSHPLSVIRRRVSVGPVQLWAFCWPRRIQPDFYG